MQITTHGEWVRLGDFTCKRGLVTHLYLNRSPVYKYDPEKKIRVDTGVETITLRAAVKNTGTTYHCGTLPDETWANEMLVAAIKALAAG